MHQVIEHEEMATNSPASGKKHSNNYKIHHLNLLENSDEITSTNKTLDMT